MANGHRNQLIVLIEFTDPYCTWCWGSEPVLRKIGEVYGNQVKIGFVMGGLVRDIGEFYDPLNRIGGKGWNQQVAKHWLAASAAHGMPVDASGFSEIQADFTSTYPANIAVKAAEFQGQAKAARFLRRLREAAAAEGRQVHQEAVLAELAEAVGLEVSRFRRDLGSGRAERAFDGDLALCRKYGVTGFPTFLIRNREGKEKLIRGYHPYIHFQKIFPELSPDVRESQPEFNQKNVLRFVKKHGRVATIEVAILFDIGKEPARQFLEKLKGEGYIGRVKAGNDFFWG